ncbi:MAG TPA: SufD family Fe-S cluster assembly protein [Solirubrobacteraceae bacterium]|nr:SufD family Fe-S cluster assembly protein [Solirubrobacteraceae bacterium]
MPEPAPGSANGAPIGASDGPGTNDAGGQGPIKVKPGRHREASLYHALHGAGAGGSSAAQIREAALGFFEAAELPVWRRSGFWATSFQGLDLDGLQTKAHEPGKVPDFVTETLPERERAGRIVQLDGSVVHVECKQELADAGVVVCSLEAALRTGDLPLGALGADVPANVRELAAEHFSKRLTYDRNKLEAANAAFWTGGAFVYVPPGVVVEDPFEIVYAIGGQGVAQYGRTLVIGGKNSDFKLHEYELAEEFEDGQALHAGAFEMYLDDGARCRYAQLQDWSQGRPGEAAGETSGVYDCSTRYVGVGRDAYCHWLPSLLGGHLVRQHLELAVNEPGGDMAFRGLFFTERDEQLDAFAVDLHETGPSGGDVHWRGAAAGQSKASFEGLIQIDQGAQQTHTYLQIHTMMLSPKARLDAIPSVLVSADDVSASHGGTVGELDESAIFYMQSRGLDRPAAVRLLVEGFFEPVLGELRDEPLEELVRAKLAAKLANAREDIEAYASSR